MFADRKDAGQQLARALADYADEDVAVPVAGERAVGEIGALVDEMVVLEKPPFFRAVAQVYRNWYDVSDGEVLRIMEAWQDSGVSE